MPSSHEELDSYLSGKHRTLTALPALRKIEPRSTERNSFYQQIGKVSTPLFSRPSPSRCCSATPRARSSCSSSTSSTCWSTTRPSGSPPRPSSPSSSPSSVRTFSENATPAVLPVWWIFFLARSKLLLSIPFIISGNNVRCHAQGMSHLDLHL